MTPDSAALEGQVALVIGGTRGIGWAVCEALCSRGAHVVTCGTRQDGVAGALAIAAERRWSLEAVQADARRETDLDALVRHAAKRSGSIRGLRVTSGG